MGIYVVTVLMLIIMVVNAEQSLLCASWSSIERELIHEAQQVNCTISNNCTGITCLINEYGYEINGGIYINSCENPPSVKLSIDVPKLNINKWQKKFYHEDQFSLSETLDGAIDIKRANNKYVLGLLLDIPSGIKPNSPLLHLIPSFASSTKFHVFQNVSVYIPPCLSSQNVSSTTLDPNLSINTMSSIGFPVVSTRVQSNCSILNSSCTINEICQQIDKSSPAGICVCITDYIRSDEGKCIYNPTASSTTESPGGHTQPAKKTSNTSLLLTAILVPITVIVVAVVLIYATIRFRIFQHLRRRLRVQVYEHVLLGQDDENDDESLNPVA